MKHTQFELKDILDLIVGLLSYIEIKLGQVSFKSKVVRIS